VALLQESNCILFRGGNFLDVPTGLRPPAQGCRFGYPGKLVGRYSTATRLRRFLREKCTQQSQPHLRLKQISFVTQGSRAGNPGLEAVAPLGHNREPVVVVRGNSDFCSKAFRQANCAVVLVQRA